MLGNKITVGKESTLDENWKPLCGIIHDSRQEMITIIDTYGGCSL